MPGYHSFSDPHPPDGMTLLMPATHYTAASGLDQLKTKPTKRLAVEKSQIFQSFGVTPDHNTQTDMDVL